MAKDKPASTEGDPETLPSYIILAEPWTTHPAGKVMEAVPDLLAMLDAANVKYRPATDFERRIGGFVD
jgi:hypothetical protein